MVPTATSTASTRRALLSLRPRVMPRLVGGPLRDLHAEPQRDAAVVVDLGQDGPDLGPQHVVQQHRRHVDERDPHPATTQARRHLAPDEPPPTTAT